MSRTINWGIIGPGRIARKFASDLKLVKDAKLLAVASRSEDHARAFAEEFGVDEWYGSYQSLVSNPAIDVVYVASPHPFHIEHTLLCIENGKAVLCEKPLAINSKQVESMVESAIKNKIFLMEAMWTRFFPAIKKAEQLIKEGAIGKVKHLQADFGFHSEFDPSGRLYDRQLGGGSLLDVGIYPVFLATLILGKPLEVKAVSQFTKTSVDESTSMIFNYPSGATALLSSSIVCDTPIGAVVSGTKGSIQIPSPWYAPSGLKLVAAGIEKEFSFPFEGFGFHFEAQEVVECIQKGRLESEGMSFQFSKDLMETMDRVRHESGIFYPQFD
jgi:predicted dehydrogenase